MAKGDKCRINTCKNIITWKGTVCGTHKWRWAKYRCYDLPSHKGAPSYYVENTLPDQIVHVCKKKHGNLTISEVYERKCKDGYILQLHCKLCARDGNIKRNFKGMSGMEDYNKMLESQLGLCKICNQPSKRKANNKKTIKSLCIDHCHKTNKVRGLLCNDCNSLLGYAKDSIELLEGAIEYLKSNA